MISGHGVLVIMVVGTSVVSVHVLLLVSVTGYVSVQVDREVLCVQTRIGLV